MLLPEEAKRIKLFSISFVAQKTLDKFIENNKLDVVVTRSGNKVIYKPSIEDVDKKRWESFLSWIKDNNIIIYVFKENEWEIYKWKKEKSKLAKTKVLDLKPKRKMRHLKQFRPEKPDKPDRLR